MMSAFQWRTRRYCSYCVIWQTEAEAVASLVRGQPEVAEVTLSQHHWCPCSYCEIGPIEAEAVISFVRGQPVAAEVTPPQHHQCPLAIPSHVTH